MAHTEAFARLRRLAAMALWGERRGLGDPAEVGAAWAAEVEAARARVSRRALLQAGGAAAALVAAGCPPITDASSEGESDTSAAVLPRVVILGGGLAGLHCAYRLKQSSVRATVYEAGNRPGGRVLSITDKIPDGMVVELGGELIDSDHTTMVMLAEELDLTLEDRIAAAPPGQRALIYWAAGVEVAEATLLAQFMLVAPTIAILATSAANDPKTFAELDALPLDEWLDANVPALTMPELHAVLGAAYRVEYGRELDEQSTLNLLHLIETDPLEALALRGAGDRRYHVDGGNKRLIDALVASLAADQIVVDRQLVAARDGHAGEYRLTFMSSVGAVEEVEADHVIFALPFSTLRRCDLAGLGLSKEKRTLIEHLGYGTHTRATGVFTAPVWRDGFNASGATLTDLEHQESWDSAIAQGGQRGLLTALVGGDPGVKAELTGAESWYSSKVVDGIEAIFPGVKAAYMVGSALRMHWPSAPFQRGSFTCYEPGQWALHGRAGVREGNLHFCGEHCSLDHLGRMEGAAESGALVAHELLDDVAAAASGPLRSIVALKTATRPHPCYHGDRHAPDAWRRRG
ncbi:MAG: FAD-dependent oxidoreductase [Nannocystaceae bacterium]